MSFLYILATSASCGSSTRIRLVGSLTWLGGAKKGLQRNQGGADGQRGCPLVLQDVQTDSSGYWADVGMPYFRVKLHLQEKEREWMHCERLRLNLLSVVWRGNQGGSLCSLRMCHLRTAYLSKSEMVNNLVVIRISTQPVSRICWRRRAILKFSFTYWSENCAFPVSDVVTDTLCLNSKSLGLNERLTKNIQ